jgi:hypothetical protein
MKWVTRPLTGSLRLKGLAMSGLRQRTVISNVHPYGSHSLILRQPSRYPWLTASRHAARNVIGADLERYRALFVGRWRSEVTKAFQEQAPAEMLDTHFK